MNILISFNSVNYGMITLCVGNIGSLGIGIDRMACYLDGV